MYYLLLIAIDRSNPVAKTSFHEHVLKLHEEADKEFESEYKVILTALQSFMCRSVNCLFIIKAHIHFLLIAHILICNF